MKRLLQWICGCMAVCLLLGGLAACYHKEPVQTVDTSKSNGSNTNFPTEDTRLDDLPDDLDFNDETITIACRGGLRWEAELIAAEDSESTVDRAVYSRNHAVEQRLHVLLDVVPGDTSQDIFMQNVSIQIRSGIDEYDIIAGAQFLAVQGVLESLYLDLSGTEYLDFEKPYWNDSYMDTLSMKSGKRYCLAGDLALSMIGWATCVYFNKPLYNNARGDGGAADALYQTVLDGDWTFELFAELVKSCATLDESGENGIYGLYVDTNSTTDRITLSAGMRFSEVTGTGEVRVTMYNDTMLAFVDAIKDLYFENEGTNVYAADIQYESFIGGESVFVVGTLNAAVYYFSSMEDDYGIIPFPKFEKEMEYSASVQDNVALYMVPRTVAEDRREAVYATLECMASESSITVLPAFYESALKGRYTKDPISAQMVDIIHDAACTDFVYVYSYSLSKLGTIMRAIMSDPASNFTSLYRERYESASEMLRQISAFYLQ